MNQSVTSSTGRRWLSNLTTTPRSFESPGENPRGNSTQRRRPHIAKREELETTTTPSHNFKTESIHHQLQGIGCPAVSDISEIEIPSMNNTTISGANHEIVFVSIPKIGEVSEPSNQLTNQVTQPPAPNAAVGREFDVFPNADISPVAAPAFAAAVAAFATMPGAPTTQVEETTESASVESVTETSTETPSFVGGEIGILVEKIIDRFPLASPTVLLFVGGEPTPTVDETCAQVASALSKCNVGNVLLIDGDLAGRQLTIAGGMNHQPGLAEAINRSADWQPLVVSEDSGSFSFMPAGVVPADRWNSNELLRKMTAEMKRDFQFICISAGDAHTKQAKLWCDVCDGSYLVVSLKNSNETLAKSAVNELKNNGARVLGCVVSDAD